MKELLLVFPGHLGKDSGAVTHSQDMFGKETEQEERYINLQQAISFVLASRLAPSLNYPKIVKLVVPQYVRRTMLCGGLIDVYDYQKDTLTLEDRVVLANSLDADVIEIHNNSAPFEASGFESLCFCKEDGSGKVSESFIISSKIQETVASLLKCKIRGTKPIYDYKTKAYIDRELYILKAVKNNAVITESGFMSNKKDIGNIDVDLDGYNEQMGVAMWLGYKEAIKNMTNS